MLKGSSSSSSSSKSSSSRKVSGVRLSGGYGGSSSGGSRSSSSSSSYRPSSGSSGSWTGGRLNGSSSGGKTVSTGSSGSKSNSGSGKISGYGGYSTPVPAGAKKVSLGGSGGAIGSSAPKGYTATSSVLGAYTSNRQPASTGSGIPRYSLPGFQAISTPNSTGRIKGWNGGKLVNGVIKYPTNANVDPAKAARAQAFVDYSYGNSTSGNSSMGRIYGQDYYDELERLAKLPVGAPAWGSASGGNQQQNGGHMGGSGGGASGGYGYEDALRQAQEAAAEALRQQVEQGVSGIYAQKEPLEAQLRKSAQQLYIANMQGKKALPQQMAAQGLTGGASESANLALETTFGDGLSGLLEYYNQAIAQLDRDAANLRASGNLQQAQNASEFAKQLAQYAYETQQRLLEVQSQKELAAYRSDLDYDKWMRQQQY